MHLPHASRILALILSLVVVAPTNRLAAAPPIDPDEARPHVDWTEADKVVGRVAFVSGRIVRVGSAGRVNFLNFDTERDGKFTGIVYGPFLDRFPGSLKDLYEGKHVRMKGLVTTFAGRPQVQVTSPDQIRVLESPDQPPPFVAAKTREFGREITVATFNILNLFDDVDDPYHNDENTTPKPRDELEHVAKAIRTLDADVIAFQEVENRGYLERFIEVFLADMGYTNVVLFDGNDLRGIDPCLVSRIPVGRVTSHRHLRFTAPDGRPGRFRRDVIAVELLPPGRDPFEIWVVHLKSNSGGRDLAEPIRLGEAHELRRLLDNRLSHDPKARIIVCGDFNDVWDSPSVQTIVGKGEHALTCPAEKLPEKDRITYNKEPHRSMIDFILMSPGMAETYVDDSYKIHPGAVDTTGSDHNAVAARFRP